MQNAKTKGFIHAYINQYVTEIKFWYSVTE